MPLRVSGKNISIGSALSQRITDRVEEATSKYFRGSYSGHATVGRDGFGFRTECVLHLDSGAQLEAEGEFFHARRRDHLMVGILKHQTGAIARARHRHSVDGDRPSRRPHQASQQAQQRTLATAVGTENRNRLSSCNGETEV